MRTLTATIVGVAALVLLAAATTAQSETQQPPMTPEQKAEMDAHIKAGTPGAPHQSLASSAGTYDVKVKSWHQPGAPAAESGGTATRTMELGGRVLVEDFNSTMMGMPYTGHGMFGYNNITGKYWSTWNDTMSTGLFTSEGSCDPQRNCTFTGNFIDPVKKTPIKTRMTTRWTSPTTEIFEMYAPGQDGKEMKMMEITYNKKG